MTRDVDLKAIAVQAMERYGFFPGFSRAVLDEVATLTQKTLQDDAREVRDLRGVLWSSIDNWDSMDLDQVEYCEHSPNGEIVVKVAIADLDLYVSRYSAADRHALHNGTSVYTGVETFPLFPDPLSKGATSLLAGQVRRALVAEFTVLANGDFRPGDVYRALVQNKARLVYEEVGDWLKGNGPCPAEVRTIPGLEDQLRLQAQASLRLKQFRTEQGALELDTIEVQPVLEGGTIRELMIPRQTLAHYLIEDLMIAANGTMVAFLGKAGIPMIQRVVRVPKNWGRIVETAAMFGEHLAVSPDARALSKFLVRRREADPERFPDLSLTIVKLLGPGEYVMLAPGRPPTGHFGLAVTDYTHGTAPNRRYVDLIIQRLLKSVLDVRSPPYTPEELEERAAWLTDREKQANKVERFVRKASAAVLLRDRIGEIFPAIVTGASGKGTYVRLLDPPAEGRVMQGEEGLFVGDKIRVRLLGTDPYRGYIDFERIGT